MTTPKDGYYLMRYGRATQGFHIARHSDGIYWYDSGSIANYDLGPVPSDWWTRLRWVGPSAREPDLFVIADPASDERLGREGYVERFVCSACRKVFDRAGLDNPYTPSVCCTACDAPALARHMLPPDAVEP